ncbi:hypothetical protein [Streptomyces sp. BE133]|uniref:hypothetical protein n=1 Tax=Streptomyces sp. BE133 TaxID=3002523 RepID=UPI002E768997|nr:hypothetical protein [Streptomyces sp. BE133]MEE1809067.1 hypothetical protein [Streptomyces sp. BE133]
MTALVDEYPHLGVECVLRELHIASSTFYRWRRREKEPCERWAEEHMLVWATHQLEQSTIRPASIRGTERPAVNENLKAMLDAHLDEVDLTETTTTSPPPERKNDPKGRALRNHFPGRTLVLGLGGSKLFDLLDPEALDKAAVEILRQVRREVDLKRLRQEKAAASAYVTC